MWYDKYLVNASPISPALVCTVAHSPQMGQCACIKTRLLIICHWAQGLNWMYSLIMERTKSQYDSLVKVPLLQHRGEQLSLINQRRDSDLHRIRDNIKGRNIVQTWATDNQTWHGLWQVITRRLSMPAHWRRQTPANQHPSLSAYSAALQLPSSSSSSSCWPWQSDFAAS